MLLPFILSSVAVSTSVITNIPNNYLCEHSLTLSVNNLTNYGEVNSTFLNNYNCIVFDFGNVVIEGLGDDLHVYNDTYNFYNDDIQGNYSFLNLKDKIILSYEDYNDILGSHTFSFGAYCDNDFDTFTYNSSFSCYLDNVVNYDLAYNNGYNQGYTKATNDLQSTIDSLENSYNQLQTLYNDLLQRYNNYIEGNTDLNTLIWTIASTPFEAFKTIWDVDLLGINLGSLCVGLMFVGIALYIWRKFI